MNLLPSLSFPLSFPLSSRKSALPVEPWWRLAPSRDIAPCFSPYRAAMIKPKLAFHAVQAVINDTLHLPSTERGSDRSMPPPLPSASSPRDATLSMPLTPSLPRLFILTGSISRDIRYASHGHGNTSNSVALSRRATIFRGRWGVIGGHRLYRTG